MGTQSSAGKQGTRAAAEQAASANRGGKPPAATRAVAGAFGKEGIDRETQGKLEKPVARKPRRGD